MTNILTANEAAQFIRTDSADPVMLMLLPMVDSYILNATGRDWTVDSPIHPTAKAAAGALITAWYDNPLAVGTSTTGATTPLLQLEVEALKYRKYVFYGRNGAGAIPISAMTVEDAELKQRVDQLWRSGSFAAYDIQLQPRTPPLLVGDVVIKLTGEYGVSGDQKANFESTVSIIHQIQQIDAGDLSGNIYLMIVKNPAEDGTA